MTGRSARTAVPIVTFLPPVASPAAKRIPTDAELAAWNEVTETFHNRHLAGHGAWCDGCGLPAIQDHLGWRHATDAFPHGIPADVDTGAHLITTVAWWRGQATADDTTHPITTQEDDDPR